MTTFLSITGGIFWVVALAMAYSAYLCRIVAWVLMAYANAVQSGREMFRRELDRLQGPVVGK